MRDELACTMYVAESNNMHEKKEKANKNRYALFFFFYRDGDKGRNQIPNIRTYERAPQEQKGTARRARKCSKRITCSRCQVLE